MTYSFASFSLSCCSPSKWIVARLSTSAPPALRRELARVAIPSAAKNRPTRLHKNESELEKVTVPFNGARERTLLQIDLNYTAKVGQIYYRILENIDETTNYTYNIKLFKNMKTTPKTRLSHDPRYAHIVSGISTQEFSRYCRSRGPACDFRHIFLIFYPL